MRIVVRVFGIPVLTVDVMDGVFVSDVEDDECDTRIEGGSAHNFERDVNPVTPEDRYNWEWEDKRGGFGFRPR
jgi:hypothetical protein